MNGENIVQIDAWRQFAEEAVRSIREEQHAPGVATLLIKRGESRQVSVCDGWASVEEKTPLSIDTPIRAGSISKLVTAVAVQQQVEAGKLGPDTEIGDVVKWDLPHRMGTATIAQLITHRAGVGERFINQTEERAEDILDLSSYLRATLPKPLFAPGSSIAYSNLGISLAALAVETVAEKPFAAYALEEIFHPLGMQSATFIPDRRKEAEMADGYHWIFGDYRRLPLRHWKPYPASSLVVSTADLGRMMTALLADSCPVLNKPGALLEEQWTAVPGIPGMGIGFWLDRIFAQRVAWHTGHMPGHRTGFFTFPDAGFGVVLYYNTDENVLRPFLEKLAAFVFRDADSDKTVGAPGSRIDLKKYAGIYRHAWHPREDFGKGSALIGKEGKEMVVRKSGKGLTINGILFSPQPEDSADNFSAADRGIRVGFVKSETGVITDLYAGGRDRYQRISRFETIRWHFAYFLVSASVFLIHLTASAFGYLSSDSGATLPQVAGWGFIATSSCNLAFVVAMFAIMAGGAYKVTQSVPPSITITLALPIIGVLASAAAIFATLISVLSSDSISLAGTIFSLVLIAAECLFLYFLHYWRLLGWRY